MDTLLIITVAVALGAALGFELGRRRSQSVDAGGRDGSLRSDYFRGINYFLNEQPDKAIEVFIKLLEVDTETAETHVALGNLYRRRGEVDRAIRIHQNLVARESLDRRQRQEGLLELAQDYLSAGLLDRAEDLFVELSGTETYRVQALRQLIDIYEQEKDWEKAIDCSRGLERATGNRLGAIIAHYFCEEAEQARRAGDAATALRKVDQALDTYRGCVRASLMEADLRIEGDDFERAIRALHRVEDQDPSFLSETVERARICYDALQRRADLVAHLSRLMERYGWISAVLELAAIRCSEAGPEAAIAFLSERLRRRSSVRGLDRLLDFELARDRQQARGRADCIGNHDDEGGERGYLPILKRLTEALLEDRPVYQCSHCGFPAKSIHWQCPSCKHWNTVRPIQGVEGE